MKTSTKGARSKTDTCLDRAVDDVHDNDPIRSEAGDRDDPVLRLVRRSTIKSHVPLFVEDLAILDQIAALLAA